MRALEKVFVALTVFARIGEVYVVTGLTLKPAEPDVAKSSTKDDGEFIRLMQQEKVMITKSNLRASAIVVPKLEKPISELSIIERADAMQAAGASASQVAVELRSLELSDYPIFEEIVGPGLENIDKAFETISHLVDFVHSLSKDSENHAEEEEMKKLAQSSGVHQPRRLFKEENTRDTRGGAGEQKWHNNRSRFLDGKFSEFHGAHGAQSHASFASNIQAALQSGNMNGAYNILNGGNAHMHHRRRTSAHGHGRQLSETEQCQQLVQCTLDMSLYDMFVFFFSDNIDPIRGTVDDYVHVYDTGIRHFFNTYTTISDHAQRIRASGVYSNQCDGLLSRFHRTREHQSGVPTFEGGIVSQVCLAEGTTVYVKLDEIAKTLFGHEGNSLSDDHVKWLYDYLDYDGGGRFYDHFMPMILEPFKCARDLFRTNDRKVYNPNELFEFCQDIDTHCEIDDDFLFPYESNYTRSRRGKPVNDNSRRYLTYTFSDLRERVNICVQPFRKVVRNALRGINAFRDEEKHKNIMLDFIRESLVCYTDHYFKPIGESLELVFGQRASPGFICGLKVGLGVDDKVLPGSCCLDAPFALKNDDWGHPYKCENTCVHKGPYLAGISFEACDAQGGTWCQSEADCSELQTCIEDFIVSAQSENRTAFGVYLSDAPNITETNNNFQCGRTRQYFGFDKLFINDAVICENIEQLQNSDDFKFLEEFFKQGSNGPGGGSAQKCAASGVACLDLEPPDTSTIRSAPVQNGKSWRSAIYALEKAVNHVDFNKDCLESVYCLVEPSGVLENTCNALKTVIEISFVTAAYLMRLIIDISVQSYGETAVVDTVGQHSVVANSGPIFINMERTAAYLQERFTSLEQSFCTSHNHDSTNVTTVTTCDILKKVEQVLSILDQDGGNHQPDQDGANHQPVNSYDILNKVQEVLFRLNKVQEVLSIVDQDGGNHQPVNCKEDKPVLDVSRAIELCAGKFFSTTQYAEDCVRINSRAENTASSYRPVLVFVESNAGKNTCEYYITVTANVQDCDPDVFKTVSNPITVFIDNDAPRPTCSFAVSPLELSDGGELKNPDFLYSIAENCGGPLSVVVESFSNELERRMMARHYQQPKDSKNNSKIGVYYSSRTCGNLKNGTCITDPIEQGRRFYMNRVIATDQAGITGASECFVEVIERNNSPSGPDPPGNSIQLFSIARSSGEGYSPDRL